MNSKKRYQEMLTELMRLKHSNPDLFMDKLYDAIIGDGIAMINDNTPTEEKVMAINAMISWFQEKEEYEKCATLKELANQL